MYTKTHAYKQIHIYIVKEGVYSIMAIVVEMHTTTSVQILDKAFCISYSAYILEKGINPTILPPAMDK